MSFTVAQTLFCFGSRLYPQCLTSAWQVVDIHFKYLREEGKREERKEGWLLWSLSVHHDTRNWLRKKTSAQTLEHITAHGITTAPYPAPPHRDPQ